MHTNDVSSQFSGYRVWWLTTLIVTVALGFIFYDGLALMTDWWSREEYSHGYLIPVISALLIWQQLPNLRNLDQKGCWIGVLLLAAGFVIAIMGELGTLYTVVQYAFLVSIFGFALACVGFSGMRRIWASLIYLAFMIPLPNFLYHGLSGKMQLISSILGVAVIRVMGIPVFLEGNIIDLGVYQLQVVEACNGLRYLFPLMSFGFLCAYLYKGPRWQKLLIFISAAPWTIFLNSFRIGVTGALVEHGGIQMAEGFLHDFEGWFIFMAGVVLLFGEIWVIARLSGYRGPLRACLNLDIAGLSEAIPAVRAWKPPLAAKVSALIILVSALGSILIPARAEIIPERNLLASFRMTLGDWRGEIGKIEPKYLNALKLDDYLLADFRTPGNQNSINLYVAYYDSQRKGASVHSPRSCIPGGGWEIVDLSRRRLEGLKGGAGDFTVNRVVIAKGQVKQLVYYWFEQRGRHLSSEYHVKWMIFWDALTRNRTDGALVRLVTHVSPNEELSQADQRLTKFVGLVLPVLPEYVPH